MFNVEARFDPTQTARFRWALGLSTGVHVATPIAILVLLGSVFAPPSRHQTPPTRPSVTIFTQPASETSEPPQTERESGSVRPTETKPDGAAHESPIDRQFLQRFQRLLPSDGQFAIGGYTIALDKFAYPETVFAFLLSDVHVQPIVPPTNGSIERWPIGVRHPSVSTDEGWTPLLLLDDDGVQQRVDQMWSRRNRWEDFAPVAELITAHHPDEAMLPRVLQAHLDQNMLQPYTVAGIPDPRLWVMLEIGSEHHYFMDFATDYINTRPPTKTSVELLFLFDELAQANYNTLQVLRHAEPNVDLLWTRRTHPPAFELFLLIRDQVDSILAEGGLKSDEAIVRAYERVRLSLLRTVVDSAPAGYRVNDARFLIGTIYWRQGRQAAAIEEWRQMQPRAGDSYEIAARGVLRELRNVTGSERQVPDSLRIAAVLADERERWLHDSVERLRRFGHGAYTF